MGYQERFDYMRSPAVIISRWIVDILVVIMLALFVNQYMGSVAVNNSRAMEPTLAQNDTVLVNKAIYKLKHVKRFDLILYEDADGTLWIKRVVGLPGERLQIVDGYLYINDEKIDTKGHYELINVAGVASDALTLGADEYFVLGDWLEGSEDSRFEKIGNIKGEQIYGKVWFRVRPVGSLGPVM